MVSLMDTCANTSKADNSCSDRDKRLCEMTDSHRSHFKDARIEEITTFPIWAEYKYDGEYNNFYLMFPIVAKLANRHKTVYDPTDFIMDEMPKRQMQIVLEAEYISTRGDLYCFLSDRAKPNCPTLALRIFGIIFNGNQDCRDLPYERRWRIIRQYFPQDTEHIKLVEHKLINNRAELQAFYDQARKDGAEGLVLKPLGSQRLGGYKIKPKITLDLAVIGFEKSKKWIERKIPNSFILGIFENNQWKEFGNSSSGLTDTEKSELVKELLKTKTSEDEDRIYCNPTVVLEVVVQEVKEGGGRHPRIVRWRRDKTVWQTTPSTEVKQLINR